MKETKEIGVSISDRSFDISLDVEDVELIEAILRALNEYVKEGFPIKISQSYMTSLSESKRVISKFISKSRQMDEWRDEIRQLISVLRKIQA